MSSSSDSTKQEKTIGLKAALASTASRVLALYFSRPIRLFRPSKISGWHSLGDQSLPLLIKQKGWIVIPSHFAPPLLVNALLGTVLWTTYSEVNSFLNTHVSTLSPTAVAAISGSCAGSAQALAAAPAENVRILLEGGQARSSWSTAWKEVFTGTESLTSRSSDPGKHREEMRRVQAWVKEARDMAGRGWQGLGFGMAKDSCAFAVFFAIFEVSRRAAARARSFGTRVSQPIPSTRISPHVKSHIPRVVHGIVIVGGGMLAGLSYDFVCRPFDIARRSVIFERPRRSRTKLIPLTSDISTSSSSHLPTSHARSIVNILANKLKSEGLSSFFVNPSKSTLSSSNSGISPWLRTLGRLGPWGIAFLAWETFGPELSLAHEVQ